MNILLIGIKLFDLPPYNGNSIFILLSKQGIKIIKQKTSRMWFQSYSDIMTLSQGCNGSIAQLVAQYLGNGDSV
jgi:hypothetical protein